MNNVISYVGTILKSLIFTHLYPLLLQNYIQASL